MAASKAPRRSPQFSTEQFEDVLKDEYGTHRTFSSFANSFESTQDATRDWKCCNSLPLIHPYGPFRYFIDFVIAIGLVYTCLEVPVTLAFNIDLHLSSHTPLRIIALCVDVLLLFDVLINFRTAYFDKYDRLRLVHDPYDIAKRYFVTWFWIDLISSIPFQLLVNNENYFIFGLLRCLKILRVIKIVRIYIKFKKKIVSRNIRSFIKLSNLLLSMVLFAHFSACFWYFIGFHNTDSDGTWIDAQGLRDSNLSTFRLYSFAWYWAVVTLFTTGYGDITATNTLEQWVSSVLILIGTCFFSYFIGTLTVLITEGDKEKAYKLDRLEEAQNFCEKKKLPQELARMILTHTRYHCENNYVFDEDAIVQTLPPHLQLQIEYYLSSHFIKQIRIFNSLPDSILGQIALKIRSISCNADHKLYHKGQRAKAIYIQRTGLSKLRYHDVRKQNKTFVRGHVCGEDAFIRPKRHTSVTCETWCEFYVIPIVDVIDILQHEYPYSYLKKVRNIMDAVRLKVRQPKIVFKRYKQDMMHQTYDVELAALGKFLNQPATALGVRFRSYDGEENNPKDEPPSDDTKLKVNTNRQKSRFPVFFQHSPSMLRDQKLKQQSWAGKEQSEEEEQKRNKADDKHHQFYAENRRSAGFISSDEEDIGDIVPGIKMEMENKQKNEEGLPSPLKMPLHHGRTGVGTAGHARARKFGLKGVRRKVIKTKRSKVKRQNTTAITTQSTRVLQLIEMDNMKSKTKAGDERDKDYDDDEDMSFVETCGESEDNDHDEYKQQDSDNDSDNHNISSTAENHLVI
eukprot:780208_1